MKYQSHSPTSYAAAVKILESADTLRAKVYRHLKLCERYGATDEEMQDHLGMNPSTQRPRRIELVDLLVVKDSGLRRKTRSRREAVVWVTCKPLGERQGELF